MNVRQLKELIANAPDTMPVLITGNDHSYRIGNAVLTTALKESHATWTEDFGEEQTPEKEYGKRTDVLVLR